MIKLAPAMKKFILHWGEMGALWGINRTVAQIHALLYISPDPLAADEIARTLSVSRSNVSNSLRELQGWGIVKVVHVLGDRRDYFESMKDVWEMFRVIIHERKQREIDPTLAVLKECVAESGKGGASEVYFRKKIAELSAFFGTMTTWYEEMYRLPTSAIVKFVKLGSKIRGFLGASSEE
jgi:DNA-binding transcriptional regulator GbsR (MarR family)